MKKWNDLSSNQFHKLIFSFFAVAALIAAVIMPDRGSMFSGFLTILSQPGKVVTNYFAVGGYAATFLNMALCGGIALLVVSLPGAAINGVTVLAFFLIYSYASWGLNVINVLPTMLGACIFAWVRKEKPGTYINAILLSTGMAPLISDLLLRYPHAEVVGFNALGFVLALVIGILIGFLLPVGLTHAPKVHKGFDHFSAALPMGLLAFLLNAILFKTLGAPIPAAPAGDTLKVASTLISNVFCIAVFGACVVVACLMGCKPGDYWDLMKDSGYSVDFQKKYGSAVYLMNLGVYGLFILAYYNLIGSTFNGATFGIVFSMVSAACCGSHPKNTWPIILGYVASSFLFGWLYMGEGAYPFAINAQAIIIGVCYATGMSPVVGKYGWGAGILFGACHYLLVTSVPLLHNGFLLHNGGFTAALICTLLIPQMEKFFPEKSAV